jgi:heme exporter protein D
MNSTKYSWLAVGLGVVVLLILFVGVPTYIGIQEKRYCRTTNLDDMSQADYQYCLRYLELRS